MLRIHSVTNATVLPTRVGMVRSTTRAKGSLSSSPHPRGDGPRSGCRLTLRGLFSPPAWGWSAAPRPCRSCPAVLPTRVGMVRRAMETPQIAPRSPHPRGDGPPSKHRCNQWAPFSPPAWGWSGWKHSAACGTQVLPTRVGMVRAGATVEATAYGSPHPRGDGPFKSVDEDLVALFSPPAWGWSDESAHWVRDVDVLPTRVGMVRPALCWEIETWRSPHPRGDGPISPWVSQYRWTFSPPAWGWSAQIGQARFSKKVLPTRVGMVRADWTSAIQQESSPHPRGDGPPILVRIRPVTRFSPPAWGWSGVADGPGFPG